MCQDRRSAKGDRSYPRVLARLESGTDGRMPWVFLRYPEIIPIHIMLIFLHLRQTLCDKTAGRPPVHLHDPPPPSGDPEACKHHALPEQHGVQGGIDQSLMLLLVQDHEEHPKYTEQVVNL